MADAVPEPSPDDFVRMLELADLATPHAIRVAVTLGLIDRLAEGPATIDALAAHAGAHRPSVRSVVAILADRDLLSMNDDGHVELTVTGSTLRHPHARRAFDLASAPAHIDQAWGELATTVTTGEPVYAQVHGAPFWDHLAANPTLSASFDEYLADHAEWAHEVARLPIWPSAGTVVDVGGGDGAALATLLGAHPEMTGVLVELGAAAERGRSRFAAAGLTDRTSVVVGSFFDGVPPGADAYLLAHVFHDWPDQEAGTILARLGEAGAQHVVIVDQVVDEERPTFGQAWSDLRMRMLFGSGERTRVEWDRLVEPHGFQVTAPHPWGMGGSVLVLGCA